MDSKQLLLKNGYKEVVKLLNHLTLSSNFSKDLRAIFKICVTSPEDLSDNIYILYRQLMNLETFDEHYTELIVRDLNTVLLEMLNSNNASVNLYLSNDQEEKAIALYQQAVNGHADAQVALAHFYKSIDCDKWAFNWFKHAAELGNAEAFYWLGNEYFVGQVVDHNLEETFLNYKKAAELGHGDALNNYADMYLRGEYVEKDEEKALKIFKQAADEGVPEAMYTLGYMYENGVGTEINPVLSREWFIKSAHHGDDFAANKLGHEAIELGKSIEALTWYQLAAERGDSYGEYNLGHCYENGIGTQVNMKKAKYWYRLAALKGDRQAKDRIKVIEKLL
ncbi:tetratricopeptide repeat protein [Halolactibacillus halophilus]|nr:tetratricopeptide repeat protein [Halolactibacillus halophilus]